MKRSTLMAIAGVALLAVQATQAAFAEGAAHPDFEKLMADRGFAMMNIAGAEADDFLKQWQSVTSWLVFDAGMAKASPEDFDIPRP